MSATTFEVNWKRQYAVKRAMDVAVTVLALIILSPLLIAVAVLVKLDSAGPVLFRQERLGKDGKPFQMLKFRSMYTREVDLPPELLALNEATGPLFKLRRDPRITRVGRLIRRASIDELPQLINVLKGEMSIVGPRPPLAREILGYENEQMARLRVTPGITGLWQVSCRRIFSFDEMVELDLEYMQSQNLLLDLKIMVLTLPAMVNRNRAC